MAEPLRKLHTLSHFDQRARPDAIHEPPLEPRSLRPVRAGSNTIIVTDANHGIALPFIRSLGRAGWKVIAASHDASGPGMQSRHARHRFVYPSAGQQPAAFAAAISSAARRYGAALVIPLSEATVIAMIEHGHSLPSACRAAVPNRETFEMVLDKRRTVDLAMGLGVPVPTTRVVHTAEEAAAQASGMRPPFILKPATPRLRVSGSSRLGTVHARDVREVATQARRLLPDSDGVLLQEYVPGHGVGVNLLLRDGVPLLAFQHRRLRELPVFGGPSALRESVELDGRLYRDATALLGALRWTGLAMVEFRVQGDEYSLMEINGRAWGSIPLAVAAGVDFPAAVASLHLEALGSIEQLTPHRYKVGMRSRNLQLDVLWALSVLLRRPAHDVESWPPRREGLRALAQLLDPSIRFDVLSRDDPRPGAAEILHIARYLFSRLARR